MTRKKTAKPAEAVAAIEELSFPDLLRLTANNLSADAVRIELVQDLLHKAAGQVELLGEIVELYHAKQGLVGSEHAREVDAAIKESVAVAASVTRFMERASRRRGGKVRTRNTDRAKARTQELKGTALREGWSATDLVRKLACERLTIGHSTASSWLKILREGGSLVE